MPDRNGEPTEDEMRESLLGAARLDGHWLHLHIRDSRIQDGEGWPDDTFVSRPPRRPCILFWELKRTGQKPTPKQVEWLNSLVHISRLAPFCPYGEGRTFRLVEARIIYPADLQWACERLTVWPDRDCL